VSRVFSCGIDLGTTNSVIACLRLPLSPDEIQAVEVLKIPQLVQPGLIDEQTQLPSVIYRAHPEEFKASDLALPWNEHPAAITGELARFVGARTPIRLVASAKSWLCHSGVDCRAAILPAQSPPEVERISPLQASIHYLEHLKSAWDYRNPEYPLHEQSVILTVPASFDPAARELTQEAAKAAGLPQAVLLEEPQAAVYNWLQDSNGGWRDQVKPGDIILVADVGGGTTDLSLIAVSENEGNLVLDRIAIGHHILLGGDNMDLALAWSLKLKLEQEGKKLDAWQIQALTHGCRDAKEALMNDDALEEVAVVIPSRSSSLIGGSLRTALTRHDIDQILLEGFFPFIAITEHPATQTRAGLTGLGLPYARDARITAHLAAFLSHQQQAGERDGRGGFIHPSALLLNGGVFKSVALTRRLIDMLNDWLEKDHAPPVRLLRGIDLDLAVAKGAAYYGFVRQGHGIRIRGGTAAAYYVGVESAMPAIPGFPIPMEALCIAPFGMEEGSSVELSSDTLGLVVGEPVRFRFMHSTTRHGDTPGTRLDRWQEHELEDLAEIEVKLPPGERNPGETVPVHLAAHVTEVGTLQLEAVAANNGERWKVEFDVRANGTDDAQSIQTGGYAV
jgi:molecular chaperone DnaK (HSP70)